MMGQIGLSTKLLKKLGMADGYISLGGEVMRNLYFRNQNVMRATTLIILLAVVTMMIPGTRARVVMAASSMQQFAQSPLKETGIRIELPVGQGWFGDILFYHDPIGLKTNQGQPLDLSIYYTYGAFKNGHSLVYQSGSGYYASFYGAYVVSADPLPVADQALIERIAAYDYEILILGALGHPSPYGTFKVNDFQMSMVDTFLGYEGWMRYDANILVPGPAHQRTKWRLHYWQFGVPPESIKDENFIKANLKGRIYVRAFEDENLIIMVYMICESNEVLEDLQEQILKEGRIIQTK